MKKGIAEYRNTDYTIATIHDDKTLDKYMQCVISSNTSVLTRWIHEHHIVYPDGFLEFRINDIWDGIPWRIIAIGPALSIQEINDFKENIQIVPKNVVRNYKKWNK